MPPDDYVAILQGNDAFDALGQIEVKQSLSFLTRARLDSRGRFALDHPRLSAGEKKDVVPGAFDVPPAPHDGSHRFSSFSYDAFKFDTGAALVFQRP